MVIDTLEHLEDYVSLNPLFKDVVDFLKKNNLENLPEGKHEIKGEDLFVNITTVKGKEPADAELEYHKKMIDIQIPLSGAETYGYNPLADLPEVEFDVANDIAKVPGMPAQSYVTCMPGMFVIFFPQDAHAPCISMESQLKKAIFKVKA